MHSALELAPGAQILSRWSQTHEDRDVWADMYTIIAKSGSKTYPGIYWFHLWDCSVRTQPCSPVTQKEVFSALSSTRRVLFCGSWNLHIFLVSVRVTRVQVKSETEDVTSSLRSSSKTHFIHLPEKVLKPPADSPHAGKCGKICTCHKCLKL